VKRQNIGNPETSQERLSEAARERLAGITARAWADPAQGSPRACRGRFSSVGWAAGREI